MGNAVRGVETLATLNSGEIVKLKQTKKRNCSVVPGGWLQAVSGGSVGSKEGRVRQPSERVEYRELLLASQDSLGWKELGGRRPCKQNCRSGAQAYHFPEKKSTLPVSFLCPPRCPNPDCPEQKRRRWRTRLWPVEELSSCGIN